MIIILQKARWPIFGIGLILIAIGGFGLLTNAPWGGAFSSFSTIFGTTMSFAQVFIAFPLLSGGSANTGSSLVSSAQAPPPKAPNYPPPPGISPYVVPVQVGPQFRHYRGSAIALWLTSFFMFVQLPIALSLIQATPANTTVSNYFALLDSFYALVVVQTICVLCALRGIHAKHARSAGAMGLLAILVIGGAWILNGLAGCIFVGNYIPGQLPSRDTINQLLAFAQIDNYFIIAGDILLGISFIHGKVYPNWIGVAAIALGGINIIEVLLQSQPSLATSSLAASFLIIGIFIAIVENTATGWVLFKKAIPTPTKLSPQIPVHPLSSPASSPIPVPVKGSGNSLICPDCGSENRLLSKFCHRCGRRLR